MIGSKRGRVVHKESNRVNNKVKKTLEKVFYPVVHPGGEKKTHNTMTYIYCTWSENGTVTDLNYIKNHVDIILSSGTHNGGNAVGIINYKSCDCWPKGRIVWIRSVSNKRLLSLITVDTNSTACSIHYVWCIEYHICNLKHGTLMISFFTKPHIEADHCEPVIKKKKEA